MKKVLLITALVLIVLLAGACRSRPAPVEETRPRVPTTETTTPPTTSPDGTTTSTTVPGTTPGSEYGTVTGGQTGTTSGGQTGTTSGGAYGTGNRHSSGVILDGATNYIVVSGDMLSSIARSLYGDGSLYPLIMMVNSIITDPDEIEPGTSLTIPVVAINMNDSTARPSINSYFLRIAVIEDQRDRRETGDLIRAHTR